MQRWKEFGWISRGADLLSSLWTSLQRTLNLCAKGKNFVAPNIHLLSVQKPGKGLESCCLQQVRGRMGLIRDCLNKGCFVLPGMHCIPEFSAQVLCSSQISNPTFCLLVGFAQSRWARSRTAHLQWASTMCLFGWTASWATCDTKGLQKGTACGGSAVQMQARCWVGFSWPWRVPGVPVPAPEGLSIPELCCFLQESSPHMVLSARFVSPAVYRDPLSFWTWLSLPQKDSPPCCVSSLLRDVCYHALIAIPHLGSSGGLSSFHRHSGISSVNFAGLLVASHNTANLIIFSMHSSHMLLLPFQCPCFCLLRLTLCISCHPLPWSRPPSLLPGGPQRKVWRLTA